ncbi:ninjurin-2 isoform X4 [Cherax quadricarinatus]|uniref:ninjurin-2 isoform X4 n=1 Tax=Cherax quadricarinatus TaxID=27406 RepID=UPI0023785AA3|nr:ninjurin-2-like isoform X4 [Cherax quadricarinatus]
MQEGGKTLDPNRYATKKTVAQGMLDVALLTANASQLKYVLEVGEQHPYYAVMLGLIITSLVLQGLTAVLLGVLTVLNIKKPHHQYPAEVINHVVMGLNMLIMAFDGIQTSFDKGFLHPENFTNTLLKKRP